jgi:hypothetical protein
MRQWPTTTLAGPACLKYGASKIKLRWARETTRHPWQMVDGGGTGWPRTALRHDKVGLVDKAHVIGGNAERTQMRARVQVPHVNAVASGDRQRDLEVSARCVVRHR